MPGHEPHINAIVFNSMNDVNFAPIDLYFVKLLDSFRTLGAIDQARDAEETPVSDHGDHM